MEENDRRIFLYILINLHECMGPGQDRTQDPWICSQTSIILQSDMLQFQIVSEIFHIAQGFMQIWQGAQGPFRLGKLAQ